MSESPVPHKAVIFGGRPLGLSAGKMLSGIESEGNLAPAYLYSGANLTAIVPQNPIVLSRKGHKVRSFTNQFPAYSATVVAIP